MRALNIGPGDEVITTPYTYFATAEAISLTGAVPVFVDIDEDTFNISPIGIQRFLENRCKFSKASKYPINSETNRAIKAVIPVHLFGQCADMKQILDIGNKYKLKVFEDAAQSFDSSQFVAGKWQKAGSFGLAGAFSFYPTKNFGGLGDGGMVITSDRQLARKVRFLRIHGQYKENYHSEIGINSRLDEIQAAALLVKMKYFNRWNEERKKIWELYSERLSEIIAIPKISANNKSVYHQYVIRTKNRDAFKEYLAKNGIETKIYYSLPIHLQKCYKGLNYRKGDMPIAEKCAQQVIALPVYPGLNFNKIEYICQKIKSNYSNNFY